MLHGRWPHVLLTGQSRHDIGQNYRFHLEGHPISHFGGCLASARTRQLEANQLQYRTVHTVSWDAFHFFQKSFRGEALGPPGIPTWARDLNTFLRQTLWEDESVRA